MKLSEKMKLSKEENFLVFSDSFNQGFRMAIDIYFPKVEELENTLKEVIDNSYCVHHGRCQAENYCVLNFSFEDCPMVKAKELLKE
jgi:hypothetical protein